MLALAVLLTAAAANAQTGDGWQWSIAPYLWATDINEDLILKGEVVGGGPYGRRWGRVVSTKRHGMKASA